MYTAFNQVKIEENDYVKRKLQCTKPIKMPGLSDIFKSGYIAWLLTLLLFCHNHAYLFSADAGS